MDKITKYLKFVKKLYNLKRDPPPFPFFFNGWLGAWWGEQTSRVKLNIR